MRLDDVRGVVRPEPPFGAQTSRGRHRRCPARPSRHRPQANTRLRASPVRTVTRRGIPSLPATRWSTALVSTPAPTASAPIDRAARRRRVLSLMMVIGAAAATITGVLGGWGYAPGLGWSAAALTFCSLTWVDTRNRDADQTAALAARDDPSPTATDLLIFIANGASLVAVAYVLVQANSAHGAMQALLAGAGGRQCGDLVGTDPYPVHAAIRGAVLLGLGRGHRIQPRGPAQLHRLRVRGIHHRHDLPSLRHQPAEHPDPRGCVPPWPTVIHLRFGDPRRRAQSQPTTCLPRCCSRTVAEIRIEGGRYSEASEKMTNL